MVTGPALVVGALARRGPGPGFGGAPAVFVSSDDSVARSPPGEAPTPAAAIVAATRVEHALAAVPGVVRIQTNPITGSVLVEYEPALAPADRVYATLTGRRRLCLAS